MSRSLARPIVNINASGGGGSTPSQTAHAAMLALSPNHLYVHGVTAVSQDTGGATPAGIGDPVQRMGNDGAFNDFIKTTGSDMTYGEKGVIYPALSQLLSNGNGGSVPVGDWCAVVLYKSKLVSGTTFNLFRYGTGTGTLGASYAIDHHTTSIMRINYGASTFNHDGALPNGYLYLSSYFSGGAQRAFLNGSVTSFRTLGQQNLQSNDFLLGATNGDRTDMEMVAICITNDSADAPDINAAMDLILATL